MSNQFSNLTIYPVLLFLIYPTLSYFVPDDATEGTWQSAQTQCENAGSTLATIPIENYYEHALDACDCHCEEKEISAANCYCWIGLRANDANDPFTYDDGTMINDDSFGFNNDNRPSVPGAGPWHTIEPNKNNDSNTCVYFNVDNEYWYDMNCSMVLPFFPLCNGDKTTGCHADCTLCEDREECANSRLVCAYADEAVGGSGCVSESDTPFFTHGFEADGFLEAESHCCKLGGHLASIHNELENAWAVSLCESITEPRQECFIGLRYLKGPEWEWIDGTPFDYGMANDFGVYPTPPWSDANPWDGGSYNPNRCNKFMGNQRSVKDEPQEKPRGCVGVIYHYPSSGWGDENTDARDSENSVFICRIPTEDEEEESVSSEEEEES